MEYKESKWNGYKRLDFLFDSMNAILIIPNEPTKDHKWLFKTEYFEAFPSLELEMLSRGYYIANIQNKSRWCLDSDTERQYKFAKFISEEFSLNKKTVLVGMSCGGMQAVYLGAKHPDLVSAIYLDAPVMNFLSCPCGIGDGINDMYPEFLNDIKMTISQLINYRKHPIDYVPKLIENKIPVFLIAGDSDKVVPFHENGEHLLNQYLNSDVNIDYIIKKNCDHHPHGLEDSTPLIDFVLKYY